MSRGSGLAKGESPVIQTGSSAYRVMVWLAVATANGEHYHRYDARSMRPLSRRSGRLTVVA